MVTIGPDPLYQKCKSVEEVLADSRLVVDYDYYVNKCLKNPMIRVLSLKPAHIDVANWLNSNKTYVA